MAAFRSWFQYDLDIYGTPKSHINAIFSFQVTKTKYWKNLCSRANPEMADSSAAGYQMRKHYMTYLLALECEATGQNETDLRDFSEKQKKAKRRSNKQDKDGVPGAQATADSPSTPATMHQAPEQQPSQGEHICHF
jgi:hypothetical protein